MLKKEFIRISDQFEKFLFERNTSFIESRQYGIKKNKLGSDEELLLTSELMGFVKRANKTVNPASSIVLPAGIENSCFQSIISNIKNVML